jgi:hypothetical protein
MWRLWYLSQLIKIGAMVWVTVHLPVLIFAFAYGMIWLGLKIGGRTITIDAFMSQGSIILMLWEWLKGWLLG